MKRYITVATTLLLGAALGVGLSGCASNGYAQKDEKWRVSDKVAGYGTFAEHEMEGDSRFDEATGKINGDRVPDYFYATGFGSKEGAKLEVSLCTPSKLGNRDPVGEVPLSRGGPVAVSLADMDCDGCLDYIVATQTPGKHEAGIYWGQGDGNGGFRNPKYIDSVPSRGNDLSLRTGDADFDGRPDVQVSSAGFPDNKWKSYNFKNARTGTADDGSSRLVFRKPH